MSELNMKRTTSIELTHEFALTQGITEAIADKYVLKKVYVSPGLHHLAISNMTSKEEREDAALKPFLHIYDGYTRANLRPDEPCGCLYGIDCYKDHKLGSRTLVIESEPWQQSQ